MKGRLARVFGVAVLLGLAPFWAQAEGPIKIGAFFALSGPKAPSGIPSQLVAEMVRDEINKDGSSMASPLSWWWEIPGATQPGGQHCQEIHPLRQSGGHHRLPSPAKPCR